MTVVQIYQLKDIVRVDQKTKVNLMLSTRNPLYINTHTDKSKWVEENIVC